MAARREKNWKLKGNETTTNHNRSLGAGGVCYDEAFYSKSTRDLN